MKTVVLGAAVTNEWGRKKMDVAMQAQTNGQQTSDAVARAKRANMFRCMVFGTAFAVGLTFGVSPGMAQNADTSGTATEIQPPAADVLQSDNRQSNNDASRDV